MQQELERAARAQPVAAQLAQTAEQPRLQAAQASKFSVEATEKGPLE